MAAYVHTHETVESMVEAADVAYKNGRCYRGVARSRPDFTGREDLGSWDDIKAKVNQAWPDGLETVEGMIRELGTVSLPRPQSRQRRKRWSEDDGDEVDNDRLRSGQEFWRKSERQVTTGSPTVAIVVNIAALGLVDARDILWRGAAAAVLANFLQEAGYQVEFWAVRYSRDAYQDKSDTFQAVCLKRAGQPLDLATLVNGVSGWFLRTVIYQEMHAETHSQPDEGYGYAKHLSPRDERIDQLVGNATRFVIDGVWDRPAAISTVREIISSLNEKECSR